MGTYCPSQNTSLTQDPSAFPASAVERDEISGLARIFHHSRDEEVAKVDGTRQTSILTQGCMGTYCPSQNTSLTQDPSAFPASAVERNEISELARLLLFEMAIFRNILCLKMIF